MLFRPVGQRMLAQLVGEVAKRRVRLKFEDKGVVAAEAGSAAQEALSAGLATFSDLPVDLVDRPYCGLIWEAETQSMRVARATIVRDVILKRYGLLRIADDALLESRIRASVGEQFSTKDFLW